MNNRCDRGSFISLCWHAGFITSEELKYVSRPYSLLITLSFATNSFLYVIVFYEWLVLCWKERKSVFDGAEEVFPSQ